MANTTLFLGDCIEQMKSIPSNSIDLVYSDLPYGTTNCSWDEVIPFDKMWEQVIRVIKKNSPIVFHCQQPFTTKLISSNLKMFKYCWIWEKSRATGFLNAKKRPLVAHEEIAVFCKGTPPYYPIFSNGTPYDKGVRKKQDDDDIYGQYNQVNLKNDSGKRYPRSVQYFKTSESEGPVFHKSQKPLALCEYIISTYTIIGQTVLDFCMGSGQSGIASKKLNRVFIGIEKNPNFFEVAKKRISEPISQPISFT